MKLTKQKAFWARFRLLLLLASAGVLVTAAAQTVRGVWLSDEYGTYVGRGDLTSAVFTTADAGETAISGTLAPGRSFELLAIRVTITDGGDETGQATSANITVKMDSANGEAYNHIVFYEDYSLLGTGLQITYDPPMPFSGADELDVTFDASGGGGGADDEIVGIELVYRNAGAA